MRESLQSKTIVLRDSTLREGLEMPHVRLDEPQKLQVAGLLAELGVTAVELVGPAGLATNRSIAAKLSGLEPLTKSGIVPLGCSNRQSRVASLADAGLNHIDLLLHVSETRLRDYPVSDLQKRLERIAADFEKAVVEVRNASLASVGIGLGDVFRSQSDFVFTLAERLTPLRPNHFVLYDTVGIARPSQVLDFIREMSRRTSVALHCHFHNDLGMATANTITALENGAAGADVTIGGFGDRCGNACLEEVALVAEHCLGFGTGLRLPKLVEISHAVRRIFGLPIRPEAPIVGESAFIHSTPSHYRSLLNGQTEAYEPYSPDLVGQVRRFQIDDSSELAVALAERYPRRSFQSADVRAIVQSNWGRGVTEEQLGMMAEQCRPQR